MSLVVTDTSRECLRVESSADAEALVLRTHDEQDNARDNSAYPLLSLAWASFCWLLRTALAVSKLLMLSRVLEYAAVVLLKVAETVVATLAQKLRHFFAQARQPANVAALAVQSAAAPLRQAYMLPTDADAAPPPDYSTCTRRPSNRATYSHALGGDTYADSFKEPAVLPDICVAVIICLVALQTLIGGELETAYTRDTLQGPLQIVLVPVGYLASLLLCYILVTGAAGLRRRVSY